MKRLLCLLLCLVMLLGTLSGCHGLEKLIKKEELSVAVYSYIPDTDLFKEILSRRWAEVEPGVALNFVEWNCYLGQTPENIDIIMYDALFTTQLVENGIIQPIEKDDIQEVEGMIPFALEGASRNGKYYGIPFLVCAQVLMHHRDDVDMYEVNNFVDLCEKLSADAGDDLTRGLSTNYGFNYIWYYLDALMDFNGEYTGYEENPCRKAPDPRVMELFGDMQAVLVPVEGPENDIGAYDRALQFDDGNGRVHFGFTEDMAFMEDSRGDLEIRPISFSKKEDIRLFYADIVSVTTEVTDPEKLEYCKKLMNLIGSGEFQQELCFGSEKPQYMLPVRSSLYPIAATEDPIYEQLSDIVMDSRNRVLRFGPEIGDYVSEAEDKLG